MRKLKIHSFSNKSKITLQDNRKKVIEELCQNGHVKCKNVNYEKFALLTEGYTIGYLLQFVERAIFYAHRKGICHKYD